jgi:uroporphyrinogen decarboxylase
MKHRERVLMALRHEEPDRCPFHASFTPEFAARLRQDLRLQESVPHNPIGGGNPYDLEMALGEDMLLTSVGWANSYYGRDEPYRDEWGVDWRSVQYETRFGKGRYTEIVGHPLADDSAVWSYSPPDPTRPELYAEAARVIEAYKDEYWIAGATVTTVFECAWALRGLESLLVDLVEHPDLAEAILDIPYNYHLAAARRLVELGVDMIWIGDDIGTQTSLMMSPRIWRRFFKPRMAAFIFELKSIHPQLVVGYHSDGAIGPLVPDLVEVGVDILNPLQPGCVDIIWLKEQFGERLSFWGSIDEQRTLPFGSPQDVREEVLARLRTLGRGGGLIIGPTHHVQLDTPLENFRAMVDAITGTSYESLRVPSGP